MPFTPYLISGTVNDLDGSTLVENINVDAYNSNTGEWIKVKATSNSIGEYVLDAAV